VDGFGDHGDRAAVVGQLDLGYIHVVDPHLAPVHSYFRSRSFTSVDLPEPLGPQRPYTRPGRSERSNPSKTTSPRGQTNRPLCTVIPCLSRNGCRPRFASGSASNKSNSRAAATDAPCNAMFAWRT